MKEQYEFSNRKIEYNLGKPVNNMLLWEAVFWFLVFAIFLCGSCALWYVVFRAIGIVV